MKDLTVKKSNILLFFCVICLIFFTACSQPSKLNRIEYLKWIENSDNGVCVKKEISDFEFALLYKPIDYVVALETRNKSISKDSILKRKQQLKGYQYYTFRIKSSRHNEFFRTGMSSENEYYERLEYFVTNAQGDIKLVEGNDTISCANYHLERNYGVSPYNNIVLAFEENDSLNTRDKIFIYEDKILGVGKIAIKINSSELKKIPTLNI